MALEEEDGAGVDPGVDLGEAASWLRSFSCILRMTAVGVKDIVTELLRVDGEDGGLLDATEAQSYAF